LAGRLTGPLRTPVLLRGGTWDPYAGNAGIALCAVRLVVSDTDW